MDKSKNVSCHRHICLAMCSSAEGRERVRKPLLYPAELRDREENFRPGYFLGTNFVVPLFPGLRGIRSLGNGRVLYPHQVQKGSIDGQTRCVGAAMSRIAPNACSATAAECRLRE
jgi:hypothetical protein